MSRKEMVAAERLRLVREELKEIRRERDELRERIRRVEDVASGWEVKSVTYTNDLTYVRVMKKRIAELREALA